MVSDEMTSKVVVQNEILQFKVILISKIYQRQTKTTSGRPAYSLALCQAKSAVARLCSFQSQVRIREVKLRRKHGGHTLGEGVSGLGHFPRTFPLDFSPGKN